MFFLGPLNQFAVLELNFFLCKGFYKTFFNSIPILLIGVFFSLLLFRFYIFFRFLDFFVKPVLFFYFKKIANFLFSVYSDHFLIKRYFFMLFVPVFLIFYFIAILNGISLFPFTFPITSQILFTFLLSNLVFFLVNFLALQRFGFSFLNLFIPQGTPALVIPFVIIIETISYFARIFSLSIRLFANITSGHILLNILSSFAVSIFFGLNFIIIFILIIVYILEFFIVWLQAFVFFTLSNIYFKEAFFLH
jgi:F-type H+-transporting ATPase subunit a